MKKQVFSNFPLGKRLMVFLVFLIAISSVSAHSLLGRFFIEEPLERGEFGTAYVTIRNELDTKMEDVNVKFYIYDLGLRYSSVASDVSKDDHVVQRLFMYIPENIPAGDYLTKITVGNDQYRDTQHIYLRII